MEKDNSNIYNPCKNCSWLCMDVLQQMHPFLSRDYINIVLIQMHSINFEISTPNLKTFCFINVKFQYCKTNIYHFNFYFTSKGT